jgi:hypothetical protein
VQNLETQLDKLKSHSCEKIFKEQKSGATRDGVKRFDNL